MKKSFLAAAMAAMALVSVSCSSEKKTETAEFNYKVDRFADIEILRYKVTDFENLTPKQKELVYYLTEAALYGRDILTDQNGKYNLAIRTTLEEIYKNFNGDKESADYKGFVEYLKQVWFANGIHHHYSTDKFVPKFSQDFFKAEVAKLAPESLPLAESQTVDAFVAELVPIIFDPTVMAKRVNQADGQDLIQTSANNYYDGVTQAEVEQFYAAMKDPKDTTPISYGLNSRLVKKDGKVQEEVYKVGSRYSAAIEKIVENLKKAQAVAENEQQKAHIGKLIEYYTTGNLKTFDEYSILWVEDVVSTVDFINGFIESYGDPLGLKGAWESIVNFKNEKASHRTEVISANAQWFEDHSPVDPRFRKPHVKGISAKVINAVALAGDCYPSTPIGINLPNADWIRRDYGSKSVTIANITHAYDLAAQEAPKSTLTEFAWSEEEIAREKKYLSLTDEIHTDLHECLGHGSGQLLPGTSPNALKEYSSTLEEARADLFGLYYMADPKLVELGILPDMEAYKAQYSNYIRNGIMVQFTRVELGRKNTEAHMQNRKLIAEWCYEKGLKDNVIEKKVRDGKTYFVVNDFEALRGLFAELLAEVQRIKSEGDYAAGKALVEKYAVNIDPDLHKEVKERYDALGLKPYGGFVNPEIVPVTKGGKVTDYQIRYTDDYLGQMLEYGRKYSTL